MFSSVHAFFAPYAHFLHQLLISVRHEGKRQAVALYELLVRCGTARTYTDYFVSLGLQFAIVVAQGAGFGGASRGVVLRLEVEYQLLALIVAQQYLFSLFVDAQNFGRFVSYIHDSVPF